DEFLIEERKELELQLHLPVPKEIVMVFDKPWEGSGSDFEVVFRDGNLFRMYYTAAQLTNSDGTKIGGHPNYACYAESKDGINWVKPDLGLFEFNGSGQNNIIWSMPQFDNFTPFKDTNPKCKPDEIYKAVGSGVGGLFAFKSTDGIHWSYLSDKPIITKGKFDTQNNAFWDPIRKHYWCYVRDFHDSNGIRTNDTKTGIRDICIATSTDFLSWTEPRLIKFVDSPDVPLYTNQVVPYYRAPHLFLGFPTQYSDRRFTQAAMQSLPDSEHRQQRMKHSPRYGTVMTNGLFMSSYDGLVFHRWDEVFIPIGPERSNNWVYGDGFQSLGLLETPAEDSTASPELSFYVGEGHWKPLSRLRRYIIRIDGFVSLHARQKPGEFITKTLIFSGKTLTLNFSTSAAGSILVELQDEKGKPFPGFSLSDCDELF
ncbi:MAG: hypothetical protein PHV68_10225, partial [Candidatus Gastranaerophilales bacterium]|nr:hypothetical protein [Candidatus Gastranaerophilales bacterium]